MLIAAVLCACTEAPNSVGPATEQLILTEVARIGSQGDSIYFGDIGSVAVNGAGQIFIEDPDARTILVFSPGGAYVTRIGGPGQGPGEFESIFSTVIGPGDSVYVLDGMVSRISVFDPAFQFAYSVSVKRRKGSLLDLSSLFSFLVPSRLIGVTHAGFVVRFESLFLPLPGLVDESKEKDASAVLVDWAGDSKRKALARLPGRDFIHSTSGDDVIAMERPFGRSGFFRMDPHGQLYAGWSENIDIERRSTGGDLIGRIRLEREAVPVTLADIAHEMEDIPSKARRLIRESELPSTLPAYETFVVDTNGAVWIQEDLTRVAEDSLATWMVLDTAGQLRAHASVPARQTIEAITGAYAYASGQDSDGTPIVVVYQLGA